MEPNQVVEKKKRAYTRKIKKTADNIPKLETISVNLVTSDGEVKPKRKYTKKVKPIVQSPVINKAQSPDVAPVINNAASPVIKPKRKYTKKVKPVAQEPVINLAVEPVINKAQSPVINLAVEPVINKAQSPVINAIIKPKRKYTKKVKPTTSPNDALDKPKRKYIKKVKDTQLEQMQVPNLPDVVEKPQNIIEISKQEKSVAEKQIDEYKSKGYSVLSGFNRETMEDMIRICKDAYYNKSEPLLSDNEYDILEDFYKTKWTSAKAEVAIGAPISGKNKVTLPYKMASMDKIKPDSGALDGWMKTYKGAYVLSCKLDGVSGLYMCDENGTHRLYTRGDGTIGQEISHLIQPLKLPKLPNGTAIRGEFILPKHTFTSKYSTEYANARNLVSGMVNRKGVDEKIGDLHYVTYEVINPRMPPGEQLLFAKQLGCRVVQNQTVSTLSNEYLSALLVDWRSNYDYEIDGVIVTNNHVYPRNDGNPEYAFAFKMVLSDQVAEAKVVDVIWTPSKDGYLKPRVRIEPIQLAGVRIEYATGFNGKFIQDNKIGLGAIITMVRSGDVIPYIKSVTVPAEHALMPKVGYKWTDTMVDIMLEDASEDRVVLEKNITNFFVYLEVDGLSSGNVKRIMDAGLMSVHAILLAKKEDLLKVDGFKQKMVDKIYDSIQSKVSNASLVDIAVASGKLGRGFGKKKVDPVFKMYPDILTSTIKDEEKVKMLKGVEGIGGETAKEFVKNIPEVLQFLRECELEHKLFDTPVVVMPENKNVSHPFFGKKFVLTKTRDKEVIGFIEKMGGVIEDSMKKDTYMLIVKNTGDKSSKTEYAQKNNIPVVSVDEFRNQYLMSIHL